MPAVTAAPIGSSACIAPVAMTAGSFMARIIMRALRGRMDKTFVVCRSRFVVLCLPFLVAVCAASLLAQSGTVNWPLHNLDLAGSRFSGMDQINTTNVATLTPRWLFRPA